jgi:hypothetical protein
VSNNADEWSTPPFSGVIYSGRWCGMNVSSRFIMRRNRAGVIIHPDLPDPGQSDRAGPGVVANSDRRWATLGVLVK